VGKSEERVVSAFETWSWRRMLKIEWTVRITNGEVFQRAKEERLLLEILKISLKEQYLEKMPWEDLDCDT